jgi:hypothetical protein
MLSEKSKHLIKNYKDRGMIKWQPFIALETQQEYIDNLENERYGDITNYINQISLVKKG